MGIIHHVAEISEGFGRQLRPAEDWNTFARQKLDRDGARALGEYVGQHVYEKCFEKAVGDTLDRSFYNATVVSFERKIKPPLTDVENDEFYAGADAVIQSPRD